MTARYDIAIVGAGPAGATCAWYLARRGIRVLLLEKKAFPRDKLCGDAICSRALMHLERMGVCRQILENDEGPPRRAIGGMVSPNGVRYVGSSIEYLNGPAAIAVERIFLDVRIARAAQAAGAELVERYAVDGGAFRCGDAARWSDHARWRREPPITRAFSSRPMARSHGSAAQLGLVDGHARCRVQPNLYARQNDQFRCRRRRLLPAPNSAGILRALP